MKTVFIYTHKRLCEDGVRYVGKAKNPRLRLCQHISRAIKGGKSHHANWIRSLLAKGEKPVLEILDEVPEEHWQALEAAYIQFFREEGCDLTNTAPGGENPPSWEGKHHSSETKKRMSVAQKGRIITDEHRANIGIASQGRIFSQEARAKISAATAGENNPNFGKKHSDEVKAKMRAARLGTKASAELRSKLSQMRKGKPWSEARRAAENKKKGGV